jgi:hypothetical protein
MHEWVSEWVNECENEWIACALKKTSLIAITHKEKTKMSQQGSLEVYKKKKFKLWKFLKKFVIEIFRIQFRIRFSYLYIWGEAVTEEGNARQANAIYHLTWWSQFAIAQFRIKHLFVFTWCFILLSNGHKKVALESDVFDQFITLPGRYLFALTIAVAVVIDSEEWGNSWWFAFVLIKFIAISKTNE